MSDERTTETSDGRTATTRDIAEGFDADDGNGSEHDAETSPSLLPDDETERFTRRWQEIQTSFVDEPRTSVEQADALVADLMQKLAAGFSDERQRLEGQWDRGDDVSTENLRVALTRYRSFFDRLLAA
jgi:hypothetical protein